MKYCVDVFSQFEVPNLLIYYSSSSSSSLSSPSSSSSSHHLPPRPLLHPLVVSVAKLK
ncbi:hypothetical protein MTR_5g046440 [Medicago truncatula]|uniref:Uncharacterized protein n=1 Tax=Medicago truncatula TaxID=3880 RepID=G7JWZ1_MEDTR|nr:hypothetical protein MTR_5g046440 [Medicago truncatula]